jgi:hypothetical protein
MGDIQVEAFDVSFSSDGTTHTLTNDVGDTADAFVLNLTARRTSAGNTGSGSNMNWDDFAAAVRLTDTDELTFYRPTAGAGTIRMMGEVWRYSGDASGAHEFIKRYSGEITIASGNTYADQSVSGVSDVNNVVCFVTGVEADLASRNDGNRVISTARMTSGSNVRVERGETGTAVTVHVEVVEFTGSAWTIGHFDSGDINTSNTVTPTIYPNYDFTGTAVTISDWTTAFIWADMYGDASTNHALEDTWFVVEDNDSTSVLITLDTTAVCGRVYGSVIQNDDLSVERETAGKSIPAGLDTSLTDPSNVTTADERSVAEFYAFTDGGGTAYARGAVTAKLNGAAIEAYVHRSGNTGTYRYAGIDLSSLTSAGGAYTLVCDGDAFDLSGTDAATLVGYGIDCAAESFNMTGTAADMARTYALGAGSESVALAGTAAGLLKEYAIGAGDGAIALSGTAADLLKGYVLNAVGSVGAPKYVVIAGKKLAIDGEYLRISGGFYFTGTDAALLKNYAISADTDSFTLSGSAANLLKTYTLGVDSDSFALTGADADLLRLYTIACDSENYTTIGTAATLLKVHKLLAETTAIGLTGQGADLLKQFGLAVESANVSLAGTDVQLLKALCLEIASGDFDVSGYSATFDYSAAEAITEGLYFVLNKREPIYCRKPATQYVDIRGFQYLDTHGNVLQKIT